MIRFIREILAGLTVLDMILAIVGDDVVSASFRVPLFSKVALLRYLGRILGMRLG